MSKAQQLPNLYDDFEPKTQTLFLKLGTNGVVSFHGRNYNISFRMEQDKINQLLTDGPFMQVKSNCYVNVRKISNVTNDTIYFADVAGENKTLHISRRKQHLLEKLVSDYKQRA